MTSSKSQYKRLKEQGATFVNLPLSPDDLEMLMDKIKETEHHIYATSGCTVRINRTDFLRSLIRNHVVGAK